jgi:hypothetical protein
MTLKNFAWILLTFFLFLAGCNKHDGEWHDADVTPDDEGTVEFDRDTPREVVVHQENSAESASVAEATPVSTASLPAKETVAASDETADATPKHAEETRTTDESKSVAQAGEKQEAAAAKPLESSESEKKVASRSERVVTVVTEHYVIVRGGSRQYKEGSVCFTGG